MSSKEQKKPDEAPEVKKEKAQRQNLKDAEVLKLLEEDEDDFEEFEQDAYDERPPEQIKAKQWREDWEDEDINDDFSSQLKKELQA